MHIVCLFIEFVAMHGTQKFVNPLHAELNTTRHLLALVGVRHIVYVSRIRVNIDSGLNPYLNQYFNLYHY